MIPKFSINYITFPQHNKRIDTHHTDDPVEAGDFLMHLLVLGARISDIKHDGVELGPHAFDQMIKVAAERIASRLVCTSLQLDSVAVKHRFGFPA
jgi:hypothetical protein